MCKCVICAGCIYAEAVSRCGAGADGKAALKEAIADGSVVTAKNDKGILMHYFPTETIGDHDITTRREELSRKKKTTDEAFATVDALMKGMKWMIKSTDDQLADIP